MYLSDYHTHSRLSFDAHAPLSELAEAAADAGLDELCVTDHFDFLDENGVPAEGYDWAPAVAQHQQALPAAGERLTLKLGLELGMPHLNPAAAAAICARPEADFILGSDPDADRVGIMVRTSDGEFKVLTGNQTGVLLLDYLIGAKRRTGKMPENPVALKTIVTTEMARKVAEVNGLKCYDTFTGFKFLAEKKDKLENAGEGKVIFAYEESYGYMLGDYVRDKDAVTASMLLTEMAAWYAAQGMTLFDALEKLYEKYGHYAEKTYNLVMPGLDGLKKMADLMANLREKPPVEIAGVGVLQQKDYKDGSVVNVADGAKSTMELSGSNVLRYEMADGTSLIVRPSGTEPKVKVYILANDASREACDAKVAKYAVWAESLKK